MIKINFGSLVVGQHFYKEGLLMIKTDPVKGGGCGCRVEANAKIVEQNVTPLRLYSDSEEVEINE